MSQTRQSQWNQRLVRLQALKNHYMGRGRYDRAYKAHLAVHRVYERWANEVFAAAATTS